MALFVRFFVVLFAFWLASFGAAAALVLGAGAPNLPAPETWPIVLFVILSTSAVVATFAFTPAAIVILLAEAFRWRSVLIYALAGAAVGLFCGVTFGFVDWTPGPRLDVPLDGNAELIAGAGIAGGLVYWLVAGRNAGAWRGLPADPRF